MQRVDPSAQGAITVTTSDTVNLAFPTGTTYTRGVYVAVTGALKADMADGTTATFTGLAAGIVHPLGVKRIYATGTTATGILALY